MSYARVYLERLGSRARGYGWVLRQNVRHWITVNINPATRAAVLRPGLERGICASASFGTVPLVIHCDESLLMLT